MYAQEGSCLTWVNVWCELHVVLAAQDVCTSYPCRIFNREGCVAFPAQKGPGTFRGWACFCVCNLIVSCGMARDSLLPATCVLVMNVKWMCVTWTPLSSSVQGGWVGSCMTRSSSWLHSPHPPTLSGVCATDIRNLQFVHLAGPGVSGELPDMGQCSMWTSGCVGSARCVH